MPASCAQRRQSAAAFSIEGLHFSLAADPIRGQIDLHTMMQFAGARFGTTSNGFTQRALVTEASVVEGEKSRFALTT